MAISTTSIPFGSAALFFRYSSRSCRRTRLRTTALPIRRLTETPSRGCPTPLGSAYRINSGCAQGRLPARSRWKSALERRRYARCMPGRVPRGLDHGQALAALQPAAAQDVAPSGTGHALQEAVLALARNPLRLIGAFHLVLSIWGRSPESPPLLGRRKPLAASPVGILAAREVYTEPRRLGSVSRETLPNRRAHPVPKRAAV